MISKDAFCFTGVYQAFYFYFLVLEKLLHRFIYYATQIQAVARPACMASRAGGGNCQNKSCKPCLSQRFLRQITELTNASDFGVRNIEGLLYQWSRFLADPSVLPSCFNQTGGSGFLYQVGKTFTLLHQMDCLHMEPHAETTSSSYRFEVLLQKALGTSIF